MRAFNKTRERVLSEDVRMVESFLGRVRGLLLSKPADVVLVSPREDVRYASIHMFFMNYPIDVMWINSENRVVDVMRRVGPSSILKPGTWRIYRPKKPAKYVLELGAGDAGDTHVGDIVEFLVGVDGEKQE